MSGPPPQERKHGRTPNSTTTGEWREVPDVPFAGAPPMPKPPGRRRSWHPLVEAWWKSTSTMPHCVLWRAEDWLKVHMLMVEMDAYYNADPGDRKTTQFTEIRRREDALGIGDDARMKLRIRYKQKVEPGAAGAGPEGAKAVLDKAAPVAGVIPMADRRKLITGRKRPAGQDDGQGDSDSQTA